MYFDLNIPIEPPYTTPSVPSSSKKSKGKVLPKQGPQTPHDGAKSNPYTEAQISGIEARINLLVHLGYTVLSFTQTIYKKFDPKVNTNVLDILVPLLRPRTGILYLKRLNIILDEDSEKGFGLINAHANFFSSYDLISLTPTTSGSFSLACLTHTLPSPLTAHIISLPLTLPRLNFHLKHTLVRTALRNGAAFELCYVGSLGGQQDSLLVDNGLAESGPGAKRNWWAAARDVIRVTRGKGIIVSSGAVNEADVRAPRDAANLLTLLGIPQDAAHHAMTSTPRSITIRAQTRRTYRAVFSEPKVVIPQGSMDIIHHAASEVAATQEEEEASRTPRGVGDVRADVGEFVVVQTGTKRPHEDVAAEAISSAVPIVGEIAGQPQGQAQTETMELGQSSGELNERAQTQEREREGGIPTKKKKRKKNSRPLESSVGS